MLHIIQKNHKFTNPLKPLEDVNFIIIHHTGAEVDQSSEEIHDFHKRPKPDGRGFYGIGYHYLLRFSGTIETGRPSWAQGAHVLGRNNDTLGIGVCGNFNIADLIRDRPQQLKALVLLCRDELRKKHPRAKFGKHEDFQATECPGFKFPFTKFKEAVNVETTPKWKEDGFRWLKDNGLVTAEFWRPEDIVDLGLLGIILSRIKLTGDGGEK